MLRKLTHTDEVVALPLLADTATVNAQMDEARKQANAELTKKGDGLSDEILKIVCATVGESQALDVFKGLETAAVSLIDKKVRPKQIEKALERLRETMKSHDAKEAIAFVRAQLAIQKYRESSDVHDLLNPNPSEAAQVHVRALTADERRKAERSAGRKPRRGALVASRAYDIMRRATREGLDGSKTYAEHVSKLPESDQEAIEKFELWSISVDRAIFKAGTYKVDGFDIERTEEGFDVDAFLSQCVEAEEVITETARHIRNIATLGKSVSLSQSSEVSGTGEREEGAQASETAGSAPNAHTEVEHLQSQAN
jgi:hypothetical protein